MRLRISTDIMQSPGVDGNCANCGPSSGRGRMFTMMPRTGYKPEDPGPAEGRTNVLRTDGQTQTVSCVVARRVCGGLQDVRDVTENWISGRMDCSGTLW